MTTLPSSPARTLARFVAGAAAVLFALATPPWADAQSLAELEKAARAEGAIASLGMPDAWANWKATWADLNRLYGLAHTDTDMSSAEEIAKFEAERSNATADIGDVGFDFGKVAKARGITRAYKPSTWAQIPDWAKDPEGHWAVAYTGTIAFAINTRRVPNPPKTWKELAAGNYRVALGELGRAAQANVSLLAAAVALGGSETDLKPGLALFAKMAREKRLLLTNPTPAMMERGEADVLLLWDFNALNYRDAVPNKADFLVLIPADGSITSGYTTLINKYAKHPNAASLAREYIFSDTGQRNLARGYARPIRIAQLTLPPELRGKLIDSAQYKAARPVNPEPWAETIKQIPRMWQAAQAAP